MKCLTWLLSVVVAVLVVVRVEAQVPRLDDATPEASFDAMAEYLARDGGRWVAPNPNHDGSGASPPEFGLWFERDVNDRLLELRIVVMFSDRTVVSSRGHWAWHPAREELVYVMVDRGGGVTEGATTFPDARTFKTLATRFAGNGSSEHRDDNVLVSPDLHRNETFHREGEDWVSGGVYEWRRVVGAGGRGVSATGYCSTRSDRGWRSVRLAPLEHTPQATRQRSVLSRRRRPLWERPTLAE